MIGTARIEQTRKADTWTLQTIVSQQAFVHWRYTSYLLKVPVTTDKYGDSTWVFPKIRVPQNGWFIMENLIKMDDLGVPLFSETSTWFLFTLLSVHWGWMNFYLDGQWLVGPMNVWKRCWKFIEPLKIQTVSGDSHACKIKASFLVVHVETPWNISMVSLSVDQANGEQISNMSKKGSWFWFGKKHLFKRLLIRSM